MADATQRPWVDRGAIQHLRTPGQHLRFSAADVEAFLRKQGYPLPPEFASNPLRELAEFGPRARIDEVLSNGRLILRIERCDVAALRQFEGCDVVLALPQGGA